MSASRIVVLASSIAAAAAASLCCIAPVVAALLGLTSFASALALEPWRPYLLGLTGTLLAAVFLLHRRNGHSSRLVLGITTLSVLGLAAFPFYSGQILHAVSAATDPQKTKQQSLTRVEFQIEGMTCESCASGLQASLGRAPGVTKAIVDYTNKKAIISFDPSKQDRQGLSKLITGSGYTLKKLNN